MAPVDVHAWTWVYLMISFFWLISSITMLTRKFCWPSDLPLIMTSCFRLDVKRKYLQYVNIFLYFWIGITLAISVIDLALGILFGLDYDRVMVMQILQSNSSCQLNVNQKWAKCLGTITC